jgi:hypothetical protein
MRSLVIVAVLSSNAIADKPRLRVDDIIASRDSLVAALADTIELRGVLFSDASCAKRFGHPQRVRGTDRAALAGCVVALHPEAIGLTVGASTALTAKREDGDDLVIWLGARDRHIVSIGGAIADDRPTVTRFDGIVEASASTKAIIEKTGRWASAAIELCHDARGEVTTRKLVRSSEVADYDREVVAHFAAIDRVKPVQFGGSPIAVCELLLVTSAAPTAPPPPPPPDTKSQNIAPTMLESHRVAGDKNIMPDDATKVQMVADGKDRVIGSFKVCVDTAGGVVTVTTLKPTGYDEYDAKIRGLIKTTWKYKPYEIEGHVVPVCTAVTFIYSQK